MSGYVSGNLLPWKRFWVPWDGKVNCGDDGRGFLQDPEDSWGKIWNPQVTEIEPLLDKRCVVLSGHPGMGKTVAIDTAIAKLRQTLQPPNIVLQLRCRDIPSADVLKQLTLDSAEWKNTRQRGGEVTLVIDGVDEGLRKVPEFVRTLRAFLREEPKDKLRVILVCRSAEWDAVAGHELMEMWPEDQRAGVMELCPLRLTDAREAATAMKLDPDAFITAIHDKGVQGMAARPILLKMLLREFERGRSFPNSSRALYLCAAREMCTEIDEDRERVLARRYKRPSDGQIFHTTCRIAALMMLCGKSVILRSRDEPAEHELPVKTLVGGRESFEGEVFEVTKELVDAALETPHFSFRGQNRFGFDHQTFAEALTAEYLRDLDFLQIRRLLCQPLGDREFVAPQLAEVASWLACSRSDWAEFLIRHDPVVLLRTDVSELKDAEKEKTVDALLARAGQLEVFDELSLFRGYNALRHSRLATQLMPWIIDETKPSNARHLAIGLAGHARVKGLEPHLWRLLRTGKAERLFGTIVHAIGRLAGRHSRRNVICALRGEFIGDTRQDLLGVALRAAVPKLLPLRKVLRCLKPVAQEGYVGSYRVALDYHLPEHITKADLPILLKVMRKWPNCFDSLSHFHELAQHAFAAALDHLSDVRLRQDIVALWISRARKFERLPDPSYKPKRGRAAAFCDPSRRFRLIHALLNSPRAKPRDLIGLGHGLLMVEDLQWLLRELPKVSSKNRKTWASVAVSLAWSAASNELSNAKTNRLSDCKDEFLAAYATSLELRGMLPVTRRFDAVITLLRHAKANDLRQKRRQEKWLKERGVRTPPPRRQQFSTVFGNLRRTKHPSWWTAIVQIAYWHDESESDEKSLHDISTAPGWRSLTASEQSEARQAAREFLTCCSDSEREPNQSTNFSEAAYYALALHRHAIRKDSQLRTAVVQKWVPVVVDFFNNAEPKHQEMVGFIYNLAPARTLKRLLEHLRRDAKAEGFGLSLRAFAGCWNRRLSTAVMHFAERSVANPRLFRSILFFIAEHDPGAAIKTITQCIRKARRNGLRSWHVQACVSVALLKFPNRFWDMAWRLIEGASREDATHFFLRNSDETDERSNFLAGLTESQLGALYSRLLALFPPEKTQLSDGKARFLGPSDHMRRLRDSVISHLVSLGTEAALRELQMLIAHQPAKRREYLMWFYHKALHNRLRRLWAIHVLSAGEVLSLSRSRNARLVETEDDLLNAVMESLERLQREMKLGGLISVHDLWNTPVRQPASPKAEDFVSRKIAAWLRTDLGSAVIVNREVQVESLGSGRVDLKIQALSKSAVNPRSLVVVVEVKRCSHKDVAEGCQTQLVEGYLKRNDWTHGVYVVGWFGVASAPQARWSTIEEATASVDGWVTSAARQSVHVIGFVLDCRLNATTTPSTLKRKGRATDAR
ncbi:MAG: hypothetical protein WC429_02030 [Verrucomicrobiia bacterium]|jgi:hypothetical protein